MKDFTPFNASHTRQEAQAVLQRDGYLFFKNSLPPDALLLVHRAFCDAAYEGGWTKDRGSDDRPPVAEMQAACASPDPAYLSVYHQLYRNERFHCLTHLPEIEELARSLIGGEVIVHPRIVGRIIFPRRHDLTTPPHQDFFQVRGTPNFVTFWIPLHDCSVSQGSLRIARGSHASGLLPVVPSSGASGATVDVPTDEFDWFCGDFKRGDLVVFRGMTVHMAGYNDTDLLRFSMDMRWQSRCEPVSERSLEFSPLSDLDWDMVTADWACNKHLTWRDEDLKVEPYSSEVTGERDRAALELARNGDIKTSLASLQRIAAYDESDERRNEASRLLEQFRRHE
jgi:Phytanoyl-CoA dioxygenase (PhyH)